MLLTLFTGSTLAESMSPERLVIDGFGRVTASLVAAGLLCARTGAVVVADGVFVGVLVVLAIDARAASTDSVDAVCFHVV